MYSYGSSIPHSSVVMDEQWRMGEGSEQGTDSRGVPDFTVQTDVP